MNITLHRDENQKNVIVEVSTNKSKILLDGGITMEENEVVRLTDVQQEYSFGEVDAVFLSHYSTDHVTMADGLFGEVPFYCGALAAKISESAREYKGKSPFKFEGYYSSGVPILAGNIKVTPFSVDDSIHEGYLLLIEGDGSRMIYTGDYRSNGRKSFEEMVAGLPKKVDAVLCEGGVITRSDVNLVTEKDLEEEMSAIISEKKGPVFVMCSVSDFDRTDTVFHVAKRNKRVLLEDLYLSTISGGCGKAMPNPKGWTGVRAYLTTGYKSEHFRYKMFTRLPRMSKGEIAGEKFVMCIRPSMKKYMKTLAREVRFHDGVIINAMPDVSARSEKTGEFAEFLQGKGLELHTLRTSGHADAVALKTLIEAVKPRKIIPMEKENFLWFAHEYPDTEIVRKDNTHC